MFDFIDNEQSLTIRFPQKMDTYNSQKLEEELQNKAPGTGKRIVFDLEGISFISSAFLRICFKAYKDSGEGNFSLINATSEVKKVLMIAGYDKFMDIH